LTIQEALNSAIKFLKTSSSPALDAEVLLSFVLSSTFSPFAKREGETERGWLAANPDYELTKHQEAKFKNLINLRARRWPVAYLVGHKEFCGLDFKVTPDVLIPRPETELLVELALERIENSPLSFSPLNKGEMKRGSNVVDVGTGSGNIIISLAKTVKNQGIKFCAIDSSKKALAIARTNARRHGILRKIKFLHGNLLDPLLPLPLSLLRRSGYEGWTRGRDLPAGKAENRGHSLVIANLPYLTPEQHRKNPDLKYEPKNALLGGKDGLKYYRELLRQLSSAILKNLKAHLPPANDDKRLIILLEHDPAQKQKLAALAKKYFPNAQIVFHKDLSRKFRILEIIFPVI
jgi:release factor glutamine methyltransferase